MSFEEKGEFLGHVIIKGEKVPKYRGKTIVKLYNTHPSSTSDWILKVYDNSASAAYVYKGEAAVAAATKKEFLEGAESTLLVLEESDALHFQTTVTSANVFVSVLEQDRT